MFSSNEEITLSIVSHGQGWLIHSLLQDLEKCSIKHLNVLITLNVPEDETFLKEFSLPLQIIRNLTPKGFGENHNNAFKLSKAEWFAVVNPDIRLSSLSIDLLLRPFNNKKVGAIAPLVFSPDGNVEDSARRFPTLFSLFKRVLSRRKINDYPIHNCPYLVDWVAGMFIVFRKSAYEIVEGFDSRRFFMYLEDADICRRLTICGFYVLINPEVQVVHLAQRASRRNLKHLTWHLVSAFRYLTGF